MPRPKQLLTLQAIAQNTGISYPTLINYARDHAERIPSEGTGRGRRYPREAIKVFQRIRAESKPGRKPGPQKREQRETPSRPVTRRTTSAATTPTILPFMVRTEPLQLSEEDRGLIRSLIKGMRDRGIVRSLSMKVQALEADLASGTAERRGQSSKAFERLRRRAKF